MARYDRLTEPHFNSGITQAHSFESIVVKHAIKIPAVKLLATIAGKDSRQSNRVGAQ